MGLCLGAGLALRPAIPGVAHPAPRRCASPSTAGTDRGLLHPFRGARAARGEILALMDGDGQHDPREIGRLLEKLDQGYEMAVGARDS
ncbi:MAG: glycosyltransferase, partial [Myxococcales bacterium]|nr:glycosyltransferase [Myxococcales bacterium]